MKKEISAINFSSLSMMDDFGRVFFQDNRVYRAIANNKKDDCLTLFHSQLFNELTEKKLIPETTISDLEIEGHELILEHEKLIQTLQHEWSFSMIRDAALTILEVNSICQKHGYELKDAHMFNVLFRGTQPVWVDIGSISCKKENNWIAYEEFLNAVVVPLLFWSQNKIYIARKLLESISYRVTTIPSQSFFNSDLLKLLNLSKETYLLKFRSVKLFETEQKNRSLDNFIEKTKSLTKKITGINTVIFSYKNSCPPIKNLAGLIAESGIKDFISALPKPTESSVWNGYHQSYVNTDKTINYTFRFKRILEIIKKSEDIDRIIDLAGNEGLFSELIKTALPYTKIIISDYDQNAIDTAYNNFKKVGSEEVTTLLLNLMHTPNIKGTAQRLQCDLALALAVTHHLILTGGYSLSAIFERIGSFSKRYVMIEFMPLGLWNGKDTKLPTIPDWYNVEWFRSNFQYYFDIILEEKLEENRILFYGERKNFLHN